MVALFKNLTLPWLSDAKTFCNMADDIESEIGDATEITDESFSKELIPTSEVQNDKDLSQVFETIETQSVQEVEKTQECPETEEVSRQSKWKFLSIWNCYILIS